MVTFPQAMCLTLSNTVVVGVVVSPALKNLKKHYGWLAAIHVMIVSDSDFSISSVL